MAEMILLHDYMPDEINCEAATKFAWELFDTKVSSKNIHRLKNTKIILKLSQLTIFDVLNCCKKMEPERPQNYGYTSRVVSCLFSTLSTIITS